MEQKTISLTDPEGMPWEFYMLTVCKRTRSLNDDEYDSFAEVYTKAAALGTKLKHDWQEYDGEATVIMRTTSAARAAALVAQMNQELPSFTIHLNYKINPREYCNCKGCLTLYDYFEGRSYEPIPAYIPVHPRRSSGAMADEDVRAYQEHNAFRDGFLEAFGEYRHFWAAPKNCRPSVYAQEQAGAGYALGKLLSLLHYTL